MLHFTWPPLPKEKTGVRDAMLCRERSQLPPWASSVRVNGEISHARMSRRGPHALKYYV